MPLKIGFSASREGGSPRIKLHGNPLAGVLLMALLTLVVIELSVAFDFMRDRYAGYEGKIVDINNTWVDWLTLDFMPVEHVVVESPDGSRQDRLVTMTIRVNNRLQIGDQVIKKRGFNNYPQVPGKQTVAEMLEMAQDSP